MCTLCVPICIEFAACLRVYPDFFLCLWIPHVCVCFCVCLRVCVCVRGRERKKQHVCLRVLNLCFALKDREGGMGSQSVPLQINSLIPHPSFLQNTRYLQRLSPTRPLLPPHSLHFLSYCLRLLSTSLCLSVNQATCMGSGVFVWESDESVAEEAA